MKSSWIEVKSHEHGGYYGDGNSHYWSVDTVLNATLDTVRIERVDEYGGQLAGNHQFAHKEGRAVEEREAIPFTAEQVAAIVETLKPLTDTAEKYPNHRTFAYFSDRHKRLILGRLSKAVRLAGNSDYHLRDCSRHIFVLPEMVVTAYAIDKERGWSCEIEKIER